MSQIIPSTVVRNLFDEFEELDSRDGRNFCMIDESTADTRNVGLEEPDSFLSFKSISKKFHLTLFTHYHKGTYEIKLDGTGHFTVLPSTFPCDEDTCTSSSLPSTIILRHENQLKWKVFTCLVPGQLIGTEGYDKDLRQLVTSLTYSHQITRAINGKETNTATVETTTTCTTAKTDSSSNSSIFLETNTATIETTTTCTTAKTNSSSNSSICSNPNNTELSTKQTKRRCHSCLFCGKILSTLSRHFVLVHPEEPKVKQIRALPLNSYERGLALKKLRLEGDSKHNVTAPLAERLVVRKPTQSNMNRYVECSNCKGSYCPKNLARHFNNCLKTEPRKQRTLIVMKRLEMQKRMTEENDILHEEERHLVNCLEEGMHQDQIAHYIATDLAITLLASGTAQLNRFRKDRQYNDRERLRYAGKLIHTIRTKISPDVKELVDCFTVQRYKTHIIAAVNIIAGYDNVNYSYRKPSVASLFQSVIKELSENYLDYLLINKTNYDNDIIGNVKSFCRIHKRLFNRLVGKTARNCIRVNRLRTKHPIPNLEDIKYFTDYLKVQGQTSYNILKKGFDLSAWKKLSQTILVQLTIFNRRRVGEVSRLTVDLYNQKEGTSPELKASMSRLEKIFADKYVAMKLLGKRERHLCVLIDIDQVKQIDLLLSYREDAGIHHENKYLFADRGKYGYFYAGRYIREFSELSGAQNPETLRATLLRKQVATMSQLMNLNSNNIEILAKFMGHSSDVHKFTYRLTEMPLLGAKLANFLCAVNEADMSKFRGKTLEELEPILEQPVYDDDADYPVPLTNDSENVSENDYMSAVSRKFNELDQCHEHKNHNPGDNSDDSDRNSDFDINESSKFYDINTASTSTEHIQQLTLKHDETDKHDSHRQVTENVSKLQSPDKLFKECRVHLTRLSNKSKFNFSVLSPPTTPKRKRKSNICNSRASQHEQSPVLLDSHTPTRSDYRLNSPDAPFTTPDSNVNQTDTSETDVSLPSTPNLDTIRKGMKKRYRFNLAQSGRKLSRHWSKQEDRLLLKTFQPFLVKGRRPTKVAITACLKAHPDVFIGRSYAQTYTHLSYLLRW